MTIAFCCDACGRTLRANDGSQGNAVKCPACQASTVVPEELLFAEGIVDSRPVLPLSGPAPAGGITTTPPDCPACGKALSPGAVLCIECGFDLRTGDRRKTESRRFKRVWDRSLSVAARLPFSLILIGWAVFVLVERGQEFWLMELGLLVLAGAVAAPYAHVYRIAIRRNRQGELILNLEHRIFYVPIARWSVPLRRYEQALTDHIEHYDHETRRTIDTYFLDIVGPRVKDRRLYKGPDGDFMRELADALQYVAGLRISRR
jgi:hypothetical protein